MDVRSAGIRWVLPGLLLAVMIAHGGAIRNGFLYDDHHLIAENPTVSTHALGAIWTSTEAASRDAQGRGFRPLTLSSYVVDHAIGGGRPTVYHATQLALHWAVACAVFLVASALGLAPRWAAASALLMALHPVQTEAVHYLSARSSVLSTLALLAAFWSYLYWRNQSMTRPTWRWVSLGSLALAVLSKESAVVGLVWFVAFERLIAGATWIEAAKRLSLHGAVATACVVPIVTILSTGTGAASISTETALATGVLVVGRHLWSWIAPLGVSPVSPQPWVGWNHPGVWAAVAAVALSVASAYALRRRLPPVSWALLCGISALLPVLSLPFITNVALFQTHRGYLAAVGLAIATAVVTQAGAAQAMALARSDPGRRFLQAGGWLLAAGAVVVAIVADRRVGRVWDDEVGFWDRAAVEYPGEAAYQQSLGAARLRAGDASRAEDALLTATRLDPLLPRVDYNLGVVYTKLGRYDEAVDAYERAVVRDPVDVKSLANLGALYERMGDPKRAVQAYDRALTIDPTLIPIQRHLTGLSSARQNGPAGPALPPAGR